MAALLHSRIIGRLDAAPKSSCKALNCSDTAETVVECTSVEFVVMEEEFTEILAPSSIAADTSGPRNDSVDAADAAIVFVPVIPPATDSPKPPDASVDDTTSSAVADAVVA